MLLTLHPMLQMGQRLGGIHCLNVVMQTQDPEAVRTASRRSSGKFSCRSSLRLDKLVLAKSNGHPVIGQCVLVGHGNASVFFQEPSDYEGLSESYKVSDSSLLC